MVLLTGRGALSLPWVSLENVVEHLAPGAIEAVIHQRTVASACLFRGNAVASSEFPSGPPVEFRMPRLRDVHMPEE